MISALSGPSVVYGGRNTLGAGATDNPDAGPSSFYAGIGMIDPRVGYNVTATGQIGWYGVNPTVVLDQVPSTHTTTAIAAAQVPVANTPLTLVGATGAGITLLAAAVLVYGSGNTIPAGALAIDALPGLVGLGLALPSTGNARMRWYDPTKALARAVAIQSLGNDTGATFLVSGADVYGYPMTELITGVSGATATGKKAFKFVYSITPAGTLSGSNVSVGQSDVIGFGLQCTNFFYATIFNAGALITSGTGFTAADATTPSNITGDVRGTYTLQSASNNSNRVQMAIDIPIALLGSAYPNVSQALFGLTPA